VAHAPATPVSAARRPQAPDALVLAATAAAQRGGLGADGLGAQPADGAAGGAVHCARRLCATVRRAVLRERGIAMGLGGGWMGMERGMRMQREMGRSALAGAPRCNAKSTSLRLSATRRAREKSNEPICTY
jgi:hypothetical protein